MPHRDLTCVYLPMYSVGVRCIADWHTTNQTLIQLPSGAIKTKRIHKASYRKTFRGLHNNRGALAGLTDSTVGQGHITTALHPSVPGERSCVAASTSFKCNSSRQRYREGDKLKTDRGSEAYNKTKRQNDGCLWLRGLRLSLPVICWVRLKEEHVCVCALFLF